MTTIIWIALGIFGWVLLGAMVLSFIDHKGELAIWKMQAPSLLVFIANLLWPIVALLYLTRRNK